MKAKISIKDLNFYYGTFQALDNINLKIPVNKVTAFIGYSGCGKSTLLRSVNRIFEEYDGLRATGSILLDNENILDSKCDLNKLRARIGMVFQKPTPFPMSIFNNIAFGIKLHENLSRQELNDRVEWALKKASLWNEVQDKLNVSAFSLSGGQQQRLCIARAIAIKPEVLLFDEPTASLDPFTTIKIEELILHLQEEYTIAIVTHNMQQARRVAYQTAFMQGGKLIEMALTKDLFFNPKEQATRDYVEFN